VGDRDWVENVCEGVLVHVAEREGVAIKDKLSE
jgi:hypothetical protein